MQASILLFDGQTLDAVKRIQSSATGFTCLKFSPDGEQLLATTADRLLAIYSVSTGGHIADSAFAAAVHWHHGPAPDWSTH